MAKRRPLSYFTIRGTNKIVKVGDCVLMRPADKRKIPRVAHVEKIEHDNRNNVNVRVRWYCRPEETIGGRRQFHGVKELLLTDQHDVQSAHNIVGKCVVHSFKNDTGLENVGAEDYYCRFEYKAATGTFMPDFVAVYCKCEMPRNPDEFMVHCKGCKNWYHPACVDMTIEEAKNLDHFVCPECPSVIYSNNPQAAIYPVLLPSDGQQVITKSEFQKSIDERLTKMEKTLKDCNELLDALLLRLSKYE